MVHTGAAASVVRGLAISFAPGKSLEMQNLRPHPGSPESKCAFSQDVLVLHLHVNVEEAVLWGK